MLRTLAGGKIEVVLDEELGAVFAVVRVADRRRALRALEKLRTATLDAWQTTPTGVVLPITISLNGFGASAEEAAEEFARRIKPVERELAEALAKL